MPVQRNSTPLDIRTPGSQEVNTQGPGIVGPKPTQGVFDTQMAGVAQQPATVQHSVDPVVTALFGMGGKLIETKTKLDREQAYLDGALAVGAGLSEQQLQGDLLTSNWRTAGYRDTVGRLALADYDAGIQQDMKKLQEQPPEAMAEYLRNKRQGIMSSFTGMSAQARGTIFNQLLTTERAALANHTKSHTEFIIGTQSRVLQVGAAGKMDELTRSQGNPDVNIPARDAAFSYIKSNIWDNPNLPRATKEKLVGEVMKNALAQGNVNLYEMFDQLAVVPGPDGQPTTLMNSLPMELQTSLAESYRTSYNQNEARINANWHSDYTNMQLALADPNGVKPSYTQAGALIDAGVASRSITSDQATSMKLKVAKALRDDGVAAQVSSAVWAGDVDTVARSGMTNKEATKTAIDGLYKDGMTTAQVIPKLVNAAMVTGNPEMYKAAGALVQPMVASIMTNNTNEINPNTAAALSSVMSSIDQATRQGNTTALSSIMETMPEDQQAFLTMYQGKLKDFGGDRVAALESARSMSLEAAKTPPVLRAARKAEIEKGLVGTVDQITEMQLASGGWTYLKAAVSSESSEVRALRPFRGWFENPVATNERIFATKTALGEEYSRIATMYPSMPQDQVSSMAVSQVNRRIVPTNTGIVILPTGTDVNSYFGVSQSASAERIGWAIDELAKPSTEGGTVQVQARDGKLWYTELNRNGVPGAGHTIEPRAVGAMVTERRAQDAAKAGKEVGDGVVRRGKTGAEVSFNGRNNVGLDTALALKIRNKLVDFEGVEDTPYPDGSDGRTSVGVGVNSINPSFYPKPGLDGKVSAESINESFKIASNLAMKGANQAAVRWGFKSPEAVEFMAVMSYQGGFDSFNTTKSPYPRMMDAVFQKDTDKAVQLLYQTPAYKNSHKERKEWYERKVRNLTK